MTPNATSTLPSDVDGELSGGFVFATSPLDVFGFTGGATTTDTGDPGGQDTTYWGGIVIRF